MKPLVGLALDAPCYAVAEANDIASLAAPTMGPAALLRDLELRLGLPHDGVPISRRVPEYAHRIDAVTGERFYSKSFRADRIGTAATLLAWRDSLVEAGWKGGLVANGGDRLSAIAEIEHALPNEPVPIGTPDRLVRIEAELQRHAVYEEISLVEARSLWPQRWQSIFALLEARGTTISTHEVATATAPHASDVGVVQRLLRGESMGSVRGDGTLMIVRGETSIELAELAAAMLSHDALGTVIVRCTDPGPLEGALARRGHPRQGHDRSSSWRPAMQILPLALELAFEPRDPYRVMELLTLPIGPFRGTVGSDLARAVTEQPGVNGQAWKEARERAVQHMRKANRSEAQIQRALARVAEWLEAPGMSVEAGSREKLLEVAERVCGWLQRRLGQADRTYAAAYAQAASFRDALMRDVRTTLAQEEVRTILDDLARSAERHGLTDEEASRLPHVDHPSGLLATARSVFVWGAIAGTERRPSVSPWNLEEMGALAEQGIAYPNPTDLLRAEGQAWRRTILAAHERVVFFVPGSIDGDAKAQHPLLDEVAARLGGERAAAPLVTTARELLARGGPFDVVEQEALTLPAAREAWQVAPDLLEATDPTLGVAVTSLERLVSCPFSWVLDRRAKIRPGSIQRVASGRMLNGNLGHRLVEVLFGDGAFDLAEAAFLGRARTMLQSLIATEGATLLLPGASNERDQLSAQLERSMRALYRYLRKSGFRIAAVEEEVTIESAAGKLRGRVDVRLIDETGAAAVLDLKWGASGYRDALKDGRAIQLAVYIHAIARDGDVPPAGYFGLGAGRPLTTDPRMRAEHTLEGPTLVDTWKHAEATAKLVGESHAAGKVIVATNKQKLPLLHALGIEESSISEHFAVPESKVCEYCKFDALCGKRWEGVA